MTINKKKSCEVVNLPEYVLSFLKIIIEKLKAYGFIETDDNKEVVKNQKANCLYLPIASKRYRYCYDGILLIEKTINRRGFNCKINKFLTKKVKNSDDKEVDCYFYEFKINKKA